MAKRNWKKVYGSKPKRRTKKQLGGMAGAVDQFKTGIGGMVQGGKDAFKANPGGMIGTAAGAVGQIMAQRQLKNSGTADDALRNDMSQRKSAATSGLATGFAAGMNSGLGKALGKMGPLGKLAQGAVGAFGAFRGKNLAKTQQERDRKEAVGQLRTKQGAEMKAQRAGDQAFDAGPMGRTGFGSATSGTKTEDQRMQTGGVKQLRGGNMTKLPGGAVQFNGAKHSQGGIDLDKNTEVEGGETMDKVQMRKKGGKASDYIFSEYLKLGGKSYAQRHKEILNRGGKQNEIQSLAKLQERAAAADGEKGRGGIMQNGGERRKYQTAGAVASTDAETETTEPQTRTLSIMDSIQDLEGFKKTITLPTGHPALKDDKLMSELHQSILQKVANQSLYGGDDFDSNDDDQIRSLVSKMTAESIEELDAPAKKAYEEEKARVEAANKRIAEEKADAAEKGAVQKVDETGETIYGGDESDNIPAFLTRIEEASNKLPENYDGESLPKFDFSKYKNEDGSWNADAWDEGAAKTFRDDYWNLMPDELVSGKIAAENDDFASGDLAFGTQWNSLGLNQPEETMNPDIEFTPSEVSMVPREEEIKEEQEKPQEEGTVPPPRKKGDVPFGAYMGGLAQLIPPAYAFRNPPATVSAPGAQSVQAGRLHRVNHNAERAANAGDFRATQAMIENNSSGPGGMVNMIAAMSKKQAGDLQIAGAESKINKELATEEAKMQQSASSTNAQLGLQAGQFATQVAREQIKDRREEKLGALDAAAERIAGITGDVLDYKAQERMAQAIGRDGVYCRERLIAGGMSADEAAAACGGVDSGDGSGGGPNGGGGGPNSSKKDLQASIDGKLLTMVDEEGNEFKPSGEELTEEEIKFRDKKIKKHSRKMDNPNFGMTKEELDAEKAEKREAKQAEKETRKAKEAAALNKQRMNQQGLFEDGTPGYVEPSEAEKLATRKAGKAEEERLANRTTAEIKSDVKTKVDSAKEAARADWTDTERAEHAAWVAENKKKNLAKAAEEMKRGGYFRGRRKIIRKKRKIKK